eukprot:CAMPEP_0204584616 /NCGR_PEP_ID=MMETSP0661-20131031/46435_1 /ASSEMBLY_ACC=CAM_ASM_000606 /TAXON_ID=109239 /ORGANISM="Alexandrium margalefi, Strain AMGDE01CS-322" /LENGTH=184 /DNA_ID=CAMNT_0051594083 /DNA_START=336 /DNA_END=890 /DNA_ORIENTATION=-
MFGFNAWPITYMQHWCPVQEVITSQEVAIGTLGVQAWLAQSLSFPPAHVICTPLLGGACTQHLLLVYAIPFDGEQLFEVPATHMAVFWAQQMPDVHITMGFVLCSQTFLVCSTREPLGAAAPHDMQGGRLSELQKGRIIPLQGPGTRAPIGALCPGRACGEHEANGCQRLREHGFVQRGRKRQA